MSRQSLDDDLEWDEPAEDWDAHDPRRQMDQFAPPAEPCECVCFHCRRTFTSDQIWFQKITGGRDGFDGFWMCPTPNCGGAGFTFDIFPADPNHPANDGWFNTDGENEEHGSGQSWIDDDARNFAEFEEDDGDAEYDPAEPAYQMMDQWAGDDDDIEGEEWKFGLEPGQRPEPSRPSWLIEEEKKYNEPDRRPRELDWSDSERPGLGGAATDDDIPF